MLLRYFNPVGAHPSGDIGEDPQGVPNNLMPYIAQVAVGRREKLTIFGHDYDTPDGTGVRDYIHVMDIAEGHVAAVKAMCRPGSEGVRIYNLGTGKGCSVLEIVAAFERATGQKVPYELSDRRPGDVASSYATCELAEKELGWKARLSIEDMCKERLLNVIVINVIRIFALNFRPRHVDLAEQEQEGIHQTRLERLNHAILKCL